MDNAKTVGITDTPNTLDSFDPMEPIRSMQKEGVSRMRASLLSCSVENPASTKRAINQITVLRIYHQISRIVKYLDLMDKLEEKLYASLERTIDNAAEANPSTWMMLLNAQERLQKNMIESHKLLQPYLDLEEFSITDILPSESDNVGTTLVLNQASRDKVRSSAQQVLIQLNQIGVQNG